MQTFGGRFEADGRLTGTEVIETVNCDTTANTCLITVPAPGVALVYLSSDAQAAVDPTATATFATTAVTKTANTVTIDASVLATSNGQSGSGRSLSSTSKGSSGAGRTVAPGLTLLAMVITGASVLAATAWR